MQAKIKNKYRIHTVKRFRLSQALITIFTLQVTKLELDLLQQLQNKKSKKIVIKNDSYHIPGWNC